MEPHKNTMIPERLVDAYKRAMGELQEKENMAKEMFKGWERGRNTPDEVAKAFEEVADEKAFIRHIAGEIAAKAVENCR